VKLGLKNKKKVAVAVGLTLLYFVIQTRSLTPSRAADARADTPKLSLREKGARRLAQLPDIAFGTNRRLALLAKRNGKPVACSRSSLTTTGAGEKLRYKYEDVSFIGDPSVEVVEAQTTAFLTKDMHPESIDWKFIRQIPTGETTTTTEQLKIVDGKVVFTRTLPDGKETTKRYAPPSKAYAYFTPYLVELLSLKDGDRFIINNLDPETGELMAELYTVTQRARGGLRVSKKRLPAPLETEFFFLNDKGQVETHGLAEMNLTFETSTEDIVKAIENVFQRRRK